MKIHYVIYTDKDGENCVLAHSQAESMLLLLHSLDTDLRQEAKYGEGPPSAFAEKWREYLFRKMDEYGVRLGL